MANNAALTTVVRSETSQFVAGMRKAKAEADSFSASTKRFANDWAKSSEHMGRLSRSAAGGLTVLENSFGALGVEIGKTGEGLLTVGRSIATGFATGGFIGAAISGVTGLLSAIRGTSEEAERARATHQKWLDDMATRAKTAAERLEDVRTKMRVRGGFMSQDEATFEQEQREQRKKVAEAEAEQSKQLTALRAAQEALEATRARVRDAWGAGADDTFIRERLGGGVGRELEDQILAAQRAMEALATATALVSKERRILSEGASDFADAQRTAAEAWAEDVAAARAGVREALKERLDVVAEEAERAKILVGLEERRAELVERTVDAARHRANIENMRIGHSAPAVQLPSGDDWRAEMQRRADFGEAMRQGHAGPAGAPGGMPSADDWAGHFQKRSQEEAKVAQAAKEAAEAIKKQAEAAKETTDQMRAQSQLVGQRKQITERFANFGGSSLFGFGRGQVGTGLGDIGRDAAAAMRGATPFQRSEAFGSGAQSLIPPAQRTAKAAERMPGAMVQVAKHFDRMGSAMDAAVSKVGEAAARMGATLADRMAGLMARVRSLEDKMANAASRAVGP